MIGSLMVCLIDGSYFFSDNYFVSNHVPLKVLIQKCCKSSLQSCIYATI